MAQFHFEYKKSIVIAVEADSLTQAHNLAYDEAQTDMDGAWEQAEAQHVTDLWESEAARIAYSTT